MKFLNKHSILVLSFFVLSQSSFAEETSQWVGVVQEKEGFHSPKHEEGHDLEFVRQSDGKSFNIVDSPNLLTAHSDREKNLLVELEGRITDHFLFWGGNLIVKDFVVLKELSQIPHQEVTRKTFDRVRKSDI